jgi:hypothetical protein
MLCAADFALARVYEVALVGDPNAADMQALLGEIHHGYRPHVVLAQLHPGDSEAAQLTPLLHDRTQIEGKATAYVCEGFTCNLPVTAVEALRSQIGPSGG